VAVGLVLPWTLAAGSVTPAAAHGFGEKPDLPVPEPFYWAAVVVAVILSFALAALFARRTAGPSAYPTYDLLQHPPVRAVVESPAVLLLLRSASVFLLVLTITAGLAGSQTIVQNWAPTFVLVVWWVGLGFVQAALGDVWRVLNPWAALFDALTWLGVVRAGGLGRYPARLGVWPAVGLFLVVVWLELIFPSLAQPRTLGVLALAYSLLALAGMAIVGKNVWLDRCDPFAVFFAQLAKLAPIEVRVEDSRVCLACPQRCREQPHCVGCYDCFARTRARQLNLRPFAAGLLTGERLGADRVAFIVLMLSAVTFDGLIRTIFWFDRFDIPKPFDPSLYVLARPRLLRANTVALIVFALAFLGVYYGVSALVKRCARTDLTVVDVAQRFVMSLIPIAVVYQIAHYSAYLAVNGPLIIRLISDPFGMGWNLFGTRLAPLSLYLDPLLLWNWQISIVVVGHVAGVYVAHLIALRAFKSPVAAVRSQLPMVVLMIAYTLAGLWLLSTPSI
jgi:hypothetical protein